MKKEQHQMYSSSLQMLTSFSLLNELNSSQYNTLHENYIHLTLSFQFIFYFELSFHTQIQPFIPRVRESCLA